MKKKKRKNLQKGKNTFQEMKRYCIQITIYYLKIKCVCGGWGERCGIQRIKEVFLFLMPRRQRQLSVTTSSECISLRGKT